MIKEAKMFAIKHHKNQKYGKHPYSYHLEKVVSNVSKYSDDVKVIAYLHDVLEDTDATYDDIHNVFGKHVADCVQAITDPLEGTRAEKKIEINKRLRSLPKHLEDAIIVKVADRLANMEECFNTPSERKLNMYLKEYDEFFRATYREGLCNDLWTKLNHVNYPALNDGACKGPS